jgi:5-methylcytosine-specific restriction endonuclease McrA
MMHPTLSTRLKDFLPTVRVGVDFGEGAGGIAVVKGNQILHAETYVDFHETTLEKRRQLRRGRRTRHSKKMRLARLRSWILRQKLPDGTRLPDPYIVMRAPRFHPQAGVYQKPEVDPLQATSWINLIKQGRGDAEAFVKVLTLIFQKRGYKWDSIALEEMTDSKLKDFLTTARIPNDDLYADVRAQIKRREDDSDDPVRGKSKVSPADLLDLLERARKRQPQPRQAEHRSVKAAELIEVIAGFGKSAEIAPTTIQRWQRELGGTPGEGGTGPPGLLNRVLRPARFENRLRTGCAWCGKPTPRKAKVRYIAYCAAVCNLRVREGRRIRPLNELEKEVFWNWWRSREAALAKAKEQPGKPVEEGAKKPTKGTDAPKHETIKKHLQRLGAQDKMARQISDLLWNENAKGRASLCRKHLEDAALGKTMKDAGVEWQTISVRKAPNPCREQHDRRVVHRLEQILFRPGESGVKAWRYGPVQFITLEVPAPQTEQARKGEMKSRKPEPFMVRLAKETAGVCIYCDPANPRPAEDKDHVFPQSRGGPDVWDNLVPACKACNKEKDNRTPFEWFRDPQRWQAFTARVNELADKGIPAPGEPEDEGKKKTQPPRIIRISDRKRALLLSTDSEYPENPTALAHVGARPRQFVVELGQLFRVRGVKPPRIDYQLGEPLVQRIDGRTTTQLRKSWLKKADETTDNFPPKNRWDLANHAQDAALIAACPPHTWRDTVFCHRAARPNFAGQWVDQDGLAAHDLAPDWAEYMENRTWPLVRVLGRYPVGWKHTFADQNFYQNPERLDDKRLLQYMPLTAFTHSGKGPDDDRHPAETRMVSTRLDKEFRELARDLGIKKKATVPTEKLQQMFPGVRHVKVEKQPGGRLARMEPDDGPARKVQLKKASEAAVIWLEKGAPLDQIQMSVRWPAIFRDFGVPRHDPAVPPEAVVLDVWPRYKSIWLDEETGQEPGFYRVKEFTSSDITVLPENAVTDELAKRLNLKKAKAQAAAPAQDGDSPTGEKGAEPEGLLREVKLHRKDLVRYFKALHSAESA